MTAKAAIQLSRAPVNGADIAMYRIIGFRG
jgi:hypothetical protein